MKDSPPSGISLHPVIHIPEPLHELPGDIQRLAAAFRLLLPAEVNIEIELERRHCRELHKLLRSVFNEVERPVSVLRNRHHEPEMLRILHRLHPLRERSRPEILVIVRGDTVSKSVSELR